MNQRTKIELIAMDLDGTLLNDAKEISPRTVAALRAAKARGVHVTVATGRMFTAAAFFARQIGADVPVIACNGALVRGIDARESLYEANFSEDAARALLDLAYRKNWYIQWYIGDQIYAEVFRPEMFLSYKTVKGFHINEVGKNYFPYTKKVIQMVIRDECGKIEAIQDELGRHFGAALGLQQNTGFSVDITPPAIDKAVGLRRLIETIGVSREAVLACGDADNDLAMLRYAGIGVATNNAMQAAKDAADFITDDCNHDGVAKAVENFVLQKASAV